MNRGTDIYAEFGVRRVVNARGNMTMLGGSIIQPKVLEAMERANQYYVDMEELLAATGREVARLLGSEAAYITSGACAALALGTAACMVGGDPEGIAALPNTEGTKNEVIIQRGLRVQYERCLTVPGARLMEVGDENGTTPGQVEAAIGERTAAIHYFVPWVPEGVSGVVSLEEVIRIGKAHNIPIVVDAAGQIYPVERMRSFTRMGADLVCFGGKYFWAPNSTGLLVGREELVKAAALHSFMGFEKTGHRSIGRPMKLDRQEIIAVVVALREWMEMDHEARFKGYDEKVARLMEGFEGIAGIQTSVSRGGLSTSLKVMLDEQALGKTASSVARALADGNPSIWVGHEGNAIVVSVSTLVEGDEHIIGERLRALLDV